MKHLWAFCAAFCTLQGVAMDKIIVTNGIEIKTLNADGSNETVIATGTFLAALKFEPFTQKVYWSDMNIPADSSTIWRANLDGSQATPVFANQSGWVRGFAFDGQSQVFWFSTMSWDNNQNGGIWRANFDGTGLTMILGTSGVGLDYDSETGKLFAALDAPCLNCNWAEAISVMNPDGSQLEELFRDTFRWLLDAKINPVDRKLYYLRQGIDTSFIERLGLDGTGVEAPPYFDSSCFDFDPENQWIYAGRYHYETFSYTLVRFAADGSQYQELSPTSQEPIYYLAYAPERPFMAIPTLTGIGMAALMLALMAAALWALRKTRLRSSG